LLSHPVFSRDYQPFDHYPPQLSFLTTVRDGGFSYVANFELDYPQSLHPLPRPLRIRGRFDGRSAAAIHTEEQNPLRWDKTRFYAIVCAAAFIARSD